VAERDRLAKPLYGELEADERLDDDLDLLLTIVARHDYAVDLQLVTTEPLQVLAAARGQEGVLAVLSGTELVLEPLTGTGVLNAVAALIGECPPGPGAPVSMPRATYAEAMDGFARSGYSGFETALAVGGITGRAVRAVSTMVESRRIGAGQVAASGPGGRSPVVNWFDTEAGRYVVTVQQDDEERVTIEPGDQQRLLDRVDALLDEVTGH
jgi:hypothetical protein